MDRGTPAAGHSSGLAQARRRWYRLLERSPRTYCAYQRWRFPERHTVGATTDIVIEGFPGSGNSFAREAFRYANPGAEVASHMHSPAQVREAVRLGKPTIVLLRPPAAAVTSRVVRYPEFTVACALRDYRRFYGAVIDDAPGYVVATFDDVRTRFGAVIEATNQRLGSSFTPFPDGDDEAVAAVTTLLAEYAHEVFGEDAGWRMSPPSEAKDARKAAVLEAYAAPEATSLRSACEDLYGQFAELAVQSFAVTK